jgi:hypothetical protein
MRKFLLLVLIAVVVLVAAGAGTALGIHWARAASDMTVSIDGERVAGPVIVAGLGAAGALIAGVVCLIVVAALASVAIIVPVAIVFALGIALIAAVVGLSPILVPVLLVVGVCVLLSRRSKRRAGAATASIPASPTIP